MVIERVSPEIDGGRYAVKRCSGDEVVVEADAFCDGHDRIVCVLCWRREDEAEWREAPMAQGNNDRWSGRFVVDALGGYRFTVIAWVDHFLSWRTELAHRVDAADILVSLRVGADLAEQAAERAKGDDQASLREQAHALRREADAGGVGNARYGRQLALGPRLAELMERHPDRRMMTVYERELPVWVERTRARYGAWYEMFPRSCVETEEPGRRAAGQPDHGTFAGCERRLGYVAGMGFDVLYLPPIHPIGTTKRKGANNALVPAEGDPGSPWAIGAASGGHCAVHPDLGSIVDFRRLVARARDFGLEIALDIAFQCAPDHPWVREHPEWFRHRPDGSVQYAENPPKKYEDIYPIDFETLAWRELWMELKGVFDFWIGEGVAIFRVDNPHTKAFAFWEWLIGAVRKEHPEVIFLSEAFTRPKLMFRLAKLGFSQSYTYFTWRNTKHELTSYFTELTRRDVRDCFRPNLWPNTPDILNHYLQSGGRPAFVARLVLAATLGPSYGIYGPAFELMEATPRSPGSEEYLHSEKYEVRRWDLDRPDSLRHVIARVNGIRRAHPALHDLWPLEFLDVDNEQILCYAKYARDASDVIVVAVNLDPHNVQAGWVNLPLERFGVGEELYQMHDLLDDARYSWRGRRSFVLLDPQRNPAHVFSLVVSHEETK